MSPFPNLNKLAISIYEDNVKKGFWTFPRSNAELLVLIQSEMFEALEAERKGIYAANQIACQQLIGQQNFPVFFKDHIKDSLEDELADTIIRLLDLAGAKHIDLSRIYLIPSLQSLANNSNSLGLLLQERFSLPSIILEFSYRISAVLQAQMNTTYPEKVLESAVVELLCFVLSVAQHYKVDIWLHVELKLAYNRTRAHKHGKKY